MKLGRWPCAVLAVLVTSLVAGCGSVPMASAEDDAAAKSFVVPKGKSSIYLYRNEVYGGAISMVIALDGNYAGQSGPQTYFLWEVESGPHEVASFSEDTSILKLDTEPDKAYFIWLEVKTGTWQARSELQLVDQERARNEIAQCKRAKSIL